MSFSPRNFEIITRFSWHLFSTAFLFQSSRSDDDCHSKLVTLVIIHEFLFLAKMPPKKVEPEQKPLIGRVGTNLKVGIVGVPNVGKSTFFNVLTKSAAPAENFPFCTIDPNENRVPVPDARFDYLCEYHKPARWVQWSITWCHQSKNYIVILNATAVSLIVVLVLTTTN